VRDKIAYMTDTSDPWGVSPSDPGSPDAAMNTGIRGRQLDQVPRVHDRAAD